MPRHKSAKKRMITNSRDNDRNRAALAQVRSALRAARAGDEKGPAVQARVSSVLDRAVRKGVLKKATANRHKSRIARVVLGG